jgi:hypothetical protein
LAESAIPEAESALESAKANLIELNEALNVAISSSTDA